MEEYMTVKRSELKDVFDMQVDMLNGVIEYAELVQDVIAKNDPEELADLSLKSKKLVGILSEESIKMILEIAKTFEE